MIKTIAKKLHTYKWFAIFLFASLAIIAYHFAPFLLEGKFLRTDDFDAAFAKAWYGKFWRLNGAWDTLNIVGKPDQVVLNLPYLVQLLLPPKYSLSLVHFLGFILTYGAFYVLARSLRASKFVAAAMAFLFTFSPFFHSYVSTGHLGRMFLVPSICLAFAMLHYLLNYQPDISREEKRRNNTFYGAMLAVMLSLSFVTTAYQTALFNCFLLIPYALFLIFVNKKFLPNTYGDDNARKKHQQLNNAFVEEAAAKHKENFRRWAILKLVTLSCCAVLAIILAAHPIERALEIANAEGNNFLNPKETTTFSESRNWEWATQWSFPPAESIDFFAPGVLGYSSRSKTNPYWGSIGRSTASQKSENFGNDSLSKNYSITTHYFGFYAIFFFFYAIFFLKDHHNYWRTIFLVCMIYLFLLLSFGYHADYYEWFYKLPGMAAMRNPNKFLQNVHFAFFILATLGMQHFATRIKVLFQGALSKESNEENIISLEKSNEEELKEETSEEKAEKMKSIQQRKVLTAFTIFFISIFSIAFFVIYAIYVPNKSKFLSINSIIFNKSSAEQMYKNILPSLGMGFTTLLFTALSLWGLFYIASYYNNRSAKSNRYKKIIFNALLTFSCVFAAFDLTRVNKHFYNFEEEKFYEDRKHIVSPLIQLNEISPSRTELFSTDGLTKFIVWRMSPYYEIPIMNKRVNRRTPREFDTFVSEVPSEKFIALTAINSAVRHGNEFKEKALPSNYQKVSDIVDKTIPPTKNPLVLYKLTNALPLVRLLTDVELKNTRDEVFATIKSDSYLPEKTATAFDTKNVARKALTTFNPSPLDNPQVKIVSYKPEQLHLEITGNNHGDSLLVFAAHYHHDWKAFAIETSAATTKKYTVLNGKTASFFQWRTSKILPHIAVNYLNNGFIIPAKTSKVVLAFSPPYLWIFHLITTLNYLLLATLLIMRYKWYSLKKSKKTK